MTLICIISVIVLIRISLYNYAQLLLISVLPFLRKEVPLSESNLSPILI